MVGCVCVYVCVVPPYGAKMEAYHTVYHLAAWLKFLPICNGP